MQDRPLTLKVAPPPSPILHSQHLRYVSGQLAHNIRFPNRNPLILIMKGVTSVNGPMAKHPSLHLEAFLFTNERKLRIFFVHPGERTKWNTSTRQIVLIMSSRCSGQKTQRVPLVIPSTKRCLFRTSASWYSLNHFKAVRYILKKKNAQQVTKFPFSERMGAANFLGLSRRLEGILNVVEKEYLKGP